MWKRFIIRAAWLYLDQKFTKWQATLDQATRNRLADLILAFEKYLRGKGKTWDMIADLLVDWRE